mmetsp:Transcript_30750/g.30241  ORF Transcript_30750/g.30241 Transcript_30750/m.30241 type:complete len:93 (+) Transcript_30750:1479-1757(+)
MMNLGSIWVCLGLFYHCEFDCVQYSAEMNKMIEQTESYMLKYHQEESTQVVRTLLHLFHILKLTKQKALPVLFPLNQLLHTSLIKAYLNLEG